MCRLFGFRSVIKSQVHHSLVAAENSLVTQSNLHPDGWGVAYYIENAPHLIRTVNTAIQDQLFQRVSGVVSSQTVLAHLRKATQGEQTVLDTHPFQYGPWVFAHNGNLKDFKNRKDDLLNFVDPELKPFVLGTTDSEVIFFVILSELKKTHPLGSADFTIDALFAGIRNGCKLIESIFGPLNPNDKAPPNENFLTILISNGSLLASLQGGKSLYYSNHKGRCKERSVCPSYAPICEIQAKHGDQINHLVLTSEPLHGDNIWIPMTFKQLIGIDSNFIFSSGNC